MKYRCLNCTLGCWVVALLPVAYLLDWLYRLREWLRRIDA